MPIPSWDGRVNILLVDDQPDALAALEATLEHLGQNLVRARSGREALRRLLSEDFALILLDVMMPDLDGFETAALVRKRERCRNTPIIFLSALGEAELSPSRAYALGAVDCITKPIDPDVLRCKVSVFVDLALKTELVRQQAEQLRRAQEEKHREELARLEADRDAERARDREERARREMEASAHQERWLASVLEAMPTPLVLVEPSSGRTLLANRAALALADGSLARGASALPEVGALQLFDDLGNRLSSRELPVERAARGEPLEGAPIEWRLGGASGALLAYSRPLPAAHGHPAAVVLSFQDVTALKETESQLRRALAAREEFLSIAAHELRTPLTASLLQLQGASRALRPRDGAAAEADPTLGKLGRAEASLKRLARLVDDMLDLSRMSAGRLPLDVEPVDLGEVVDEVVQRLADTFKRSACELTLSIDGPLPAQWDRRRIDQIVSNLLTNACRWGAGRPISVALRRQGDSAVLTVSDAGVGIAAEDQTRIFERFERIGERKQGGGFGLGLWIVKRIVSEVGGQVRLESRPGAGATFEVTLPLDLGARYEFPIGVGAAP